jgi:hypothetical protein
MTRSSADCCAAGVPDPGRRSPGVPDERRRHRLGNTVTDISNPVSSMTPVNARDDIAFAVICRTLSEGGG